MVDIDNEHKQCTLCKKEYTSIHTELQPGVIIYVCDSCLEAAKQNFIFLCMNCGTVHKRPKQMMIDRIRDPELKKAYIMCEDMQLIQGIDKCVSCDPEGIMNYMDAQKSRREC